MVARAYLLLGMKTYSKVPLLLRNHLFFLLRSQCCVISRIKSPNLSTQKSFQVSKNIRQIFSSNHNTNKTSFKYPKKIRQIFSSNRNKQKTTFQIPRKSGQIFLSNCIATRTEKKKMKVRRMIERINFQLIMHIMKASD